MSFLDTVSKAKQYLRNNHRLSFAALKREFELDDSTLMAVIDELVEIQGVATRTDVALEWVGRSSQSDHPRQEGLTGERRHASVMFSDLSGYTRLNEELDPEEVERLMRQLKAVAIDVIEAHGGIVNQFVGDEIMGLFGIPVAHGDDAKRATSAAVELHRRTHQVIVASGRDLSELRLHTGISTGLVVAVAQDERDGRFGVTGDTVNVAARLRSLADAGEILVDDSTQQTIKRDYTLHALPKTEVRGKSEAIAPFRLGPARTVALERRSVFVGRQRELRQFDSAVQRIVGSGCAEMLYVRGEPGIGKTRFVEECDRRADSAGLAIHRAAVLNFGSGIGSDAFRALVSSLLGLARDENVGQRRRTAEVTASRLGLQADRLAALNDLLDVPQSGEAKATYDAMAPDTRDRRQIETAAAVLASDANENPILLIIEDLHWASHATLRKLVSLQAELSNVPVLTIATTRVEGDPLDAGLRRQTGDTPISTIDLVGLNESEALQLASGYFAEGSIAARACVERADGNPLFLEELLQHADESVLSQALPGSVQNVVLARFDQLSAADKRALQAASVLGQRFTLASLRFLIDAPHYVCDGPLRHRLIRPLSDDLIFSHALIQEGIYESVLRVRARQIHLKAAEWFSTRDPVLNAQHLDRGGDERAAAAYIEAALGQLRSYRHSEALVLVSRACEIAKNASDKTAAACLSGQIHNELGQAAKAMESFETALETAETSPESCRVRLGIANSMRALDRVDEALPVIAAAKRHAEESALDLELSEIYHLEGNIHFHLGNIDACQAAHEQALEHARRVGSPDCEARAKAGLADVHWLCANAPLANQHYRESAAIARKLGLGQIEVANHVLDGYSLIFVDPSRHSEILAIAADSLAKARRVNDPRTKLLALLCPVLLATEMLSEIGDAEVVCGEAEKLIETIGARRFLAIALNARGRIAYRSGDLATARTQYETCLEVCRETGFAFAGPYTMANLARAQEDPDRARLLLKEAEPMLTNAVGHNRLIFYREAIYVHLQHQDWDEADRFTSALASLRKTENWPWLDGTVTRAKSMVRFGRGERDSELLDEIRNLNREAAKQGLWEPGFGLVGAV